jgi:hypothetical protein
MSDERPPPIKESMQVGSVLLALAAVELLCSHLGILQARRAPMLHLR